MSQSSSDKSGNENQPMKNNLLFWFGATLQLVSAISARAASYSDLILSDNPVAYYRLEELAGAATALDSSPNHFDATYVPNSDSSFPELELPGIDVNSVGFNGGTDFGSITIPFHPELSPTADDGIHGAPFSIECWVRADILPGNYSVPLSMFGQYEGSAPFTDASGWNFYQSAPDNGKTYWVFNHKHAAFHTAPTAINLLEWYYLTGTFDGSNSVFYVNGVAVSSVGGVTDYLADHGADGQIGAGVNTGFVPFDGRVDEVAFYTNALTTDQILAHYQLGTNSFRSSPVAPTIVQDPVSATNFSGTTVTFSVLASGTPAPQIQWYRGTNAIAGATESNYSFLASFPADDGATFYAVATNPSGTNNSAVATLTVLTNLNILHGPFGPITRNLGGYAAFRVAAEGALPINYQWFSGSAAIAGATNDTLWLSNLKDTDSGPYHVHVSNPFTSADSDPATLTVVARDPVFPTLRTQYANTVLADRPVAYWRLDETEDIGTAFDLAGVFDGSYDVGGGSFTFGADTGIPLDTDKALGVADGAVVTIPYALELNPVTTPWSAEAWANPAALDPANFRTVFSSMWNSDSGNHIFGWNIYQHVAGVWTLNLFKGTDQGSFTSDFVHNPIIPNNWYHMVITDDLTTVRFFVNDQLVVSVDRKGFGFMPNGINGDVDVAGAPTVLGHRSDSASSPFNGILDDVAFYNYALAPSQIHLHYVNSTKLSVTQSEGNVVLSWSVGTLQSAPVVTGTYTPVPGASSPYTNAITGTQQFYRIQMQ